VSKIIIKIIASIILMGGALLGILVGWNVMEGIRTELRQDLEETYKDRLKK